MTTECHRPRAYDRGVTEEQTTTVLEEALAAVVGGRYVTTDQAIVGPRTVDHTGRHSGRAVALVRPANADQVAAVLAVCRDHGAKVTVQGGRTGLVAGTVPENDDVLLSTERLVDVGDVNHDDMRVTVGAGVTLARLHRTAADAGLLFGVDIASRDSATVGGMVATNAGGLHTVRYGNMSAQVTGLEVVLPDSSIVRRTPRVPSDNTGYDLLSLWAGSEGTLGIVTAVDVALRPVPSRRVCALAGFDRLEDVIDAGRILRRYGAVDALELIDGRGLRLAAEHLGAAVPTGLPWYLLVEFSGNEDRTEELATALSRCNIRDEPAVGTDAAGRERVWAAREVFADLVGLFGPPVKFDAALPLDTLADFAAEAVATVDRLAPEALPVLFGHIAEGNIHFNVLRCPDDAEIYPAILEVVRSHHGNVSSEHGVGTLKRNYLDLTLSPADISTMWTLKRALDPDDYLNPAVLFPDSFRPRQKRRGP